MLKGSKGVFSTHLDSFSGTSWFDLGSIPDEFLAPKMDPFGRRERNKTIAFPHVLVPCWCLKGSPKPFWRFAHVLGILQDCIGILLQKETPSHSGASLWILCMISFVLYQKESWKGFPALRAGFGIRFPLRFAANSLENTGASRRIGYRISFVCCRNWL